MWEAFFPHARMAPERGGSNAGPSGAGLFIAVFSVLTKGPWLKPVLLHADFQGPEGSCSLRRKARG